MAHHLWSRLASSRSHSRRQSRSSRRSTDSPIPTPSSASVRSLSTPVSTAGPVYLQDLPPARSSRNMAGVFEMDRNRTRRDRTFVGTECAVCEEPLEHILRGERIMQLSCGHVSHEACFWEYIREFDSQYCPTCNAPLALDTSRGGNVLDLEKLSTIVRTAQQDNQSVRSAAPTPSPWDAQTLPVNFGDRRPSAATVATTQTAQTAHTVDPVVRGHHSTYSRDLREPTRSRSRAHARSDSGTTGVASSADQSYDPAGRRHDYDVHSMESTLSPRSGIKNPIPPPTVTVRSEFPTVNRSRQQQSLTCLVTVEVPDGKWRADPEEFPNVPPTPSPRAPDHGRASKTPTISREPIYQNPELLEDATEELHARVDNWHGLDFSRFGKLRLHGHIRVGKDRKAWQDLECYLFSDMLICVKEKKHHSYNGHDPSNSKRAKCTLKGSILIKKHLNHVESIPDEGILTLSLSVAELPAFHLHFKDPKKLELWKRALLEIHSEPQVRMPDMDQENSGTDDEDYRSTKRRVSSVNSYAGARSTITAPTEYTSSRAGFQDGAVPASPHVPIDIVVVIPVSSSMQGLKISLLRDALRFLVSNLGDRDRMGLVSFGSSGGGVPMVGMTTKKWSGWSKVLDSVRPVGQKSLRADVVEGANVAMDLLMQRRSSNPVASIMLISDSSTSDGESVDFVVSRAEAAKVTIHSFGLGLTHKPDTMIELSTRTKASYTYVKDWMMLRECVAGSLGSLQTISHQNVKLKLRLPEGSPAKFVKISGALQITKRATGKDAEAALGDLRFGDKRDILVQLAITPDNSTPEHVPQDPWETIVSGLEALGGPLDQDDQRSLSVEEVPLIQADLTFGDIMRDGTLSHLPRPSLLAITVLPASRQRHSKNRPATPPIPPHPSVVQRRMELLTSDMLTRALTLVSRGQHERAHHLLSETRSILKGLAKGGLPPLPPPPGPPPSGLPPTPSNPSSDSTAQPSPTASEAQNRPHTPSLLPSPHVDSNFHPAAGIDPNTMSALDAELEAALEWMNHPAIFGRDSRKAVLQAIGTVSSQRGYTFRTPAESLWAQRIVGVKRLADRSREWREVGDEALMEEA
ncbi:von Willebrand and RING finger domain-containing protein [Phyllosticta capitalensis]